MSKKNEEESSEKTVQNFFSKQQIINSKKFALNKDFLNANLEDNKQYTLDEIEEKIRKFKEGKV